MSVIAGPSLFDQVGAWGQGVHGVMQYSGQIVTTAGVTFTAMPPAELDAYPMGVDNGRQHVLVKFPGLPAVTSSPEDIAAGFDLRDYAILAGATRQYSPVFPYSSAESAHRNDYRFGEGVWLWRTTSGRVWALRGVVDGQDIVIKARRVELVDDVWIECVRLHLGSYTLKLTWSHPDGRQAMIGINISGNPTFVQVDCSGGNETTPPTTLATIITKAPRAVSDDGITRTSEAFLDYRYKPNGTRVEYWLGRSLKISGELTDSEDVWIWINSTKTMVTTSIIGAGVFTVTDWAGNTFQATARPSITVETGTRYALLFLLRWTDGAGQHWSRKAIGVQGQAWSEMAQPTDESALVYWIEHPATGEFINAWWIF